MYRFSLSLVALIAGLCICGCGSGAESAEEAPKGPGATSLEGGQAETGPVQLDPVAEVVEDKLHKGIDVSWHSGTVDWAKLLEEGHTFAYAKATEGVDAKDRTFDDHWRQMKAAGVVRGAYHFYVTEDDPEEQARFFIETVTLEPGDLVPVVDIETLGQNTPPGLPQRLAKFLALLEAHYGVKPAIYTAPNFWDEHMGVETESAAFGQYPLWVAEYGVEAPRLPRGWDDWHLWQWRGDAPVPGVEKSADLSRVNRDHDDLGVLVVPR